MKPRKITGWILGIKDPNDRKPLTDEQKKELLKKLRNERF